MQETKGSEAWPIMTMMMKMKERQEQVGCRAAAAAAADAGATIIGRLDVARVNSGCST